MRVLRTTAKHEFLFCYAKQHKLVLNMIFLSGHRLTCIYGTKPKDVVLVNSKRVFALWRKLGLVLDCEYPVSTQYTSD